VAVGESAPASLPSELVPVWRRSIGPGFSSPVVSGGQLCYLDEQSGQETAHLLSLASRQELWSQPCGESFGDEWGSGPRSTPVIDADRVYVQTCKGEFRCLALADGHTLWRTHFEKDYGVVFVGTKVLEGAAVRRGHNSSPLVDGERIYVTVGSTNGSTLVCFNKSTGAVLWRSLSDETAYSSPVLATLAGVRQVVLFTADALAGVEPATGGVLWRVPVRTEAKRHALTPVLLPGDRVVVASHSYGMLCVRIERDGDTLKPVTAWLNKELRVNLSTPTLVGDSLFGFGAHGDYVCVAGDTGRVQWSQPGFGKGIKTDFASTTAVGNRLLVLNDAGQLFLIAPDPAQYRLLGQSQACGKSWSSPAYSRGHLYVRDGRQLYAYELVRPAPPGP
jgi:outer membrane protein assembly factor BamB